MKIYFAPMEGVTKHVVRNAYEKYYGGIDKYFAPFISPADNCPMNPKEKTDILPANNHVEKLIPQILASKAEHFIMSADKLMLMGYDEINLNIGCPSGIVCAKGKGSGLLADLDKLDEMLYEIYEYADKNALKVSLKTRLGKATVNDWERILKIYNKYPVHELIIHPRIREDMYDGEPRYEKYEYALRESKNPVIYNGDIFTADRLKELENKYNFDTVMLGRGLMSDPELPSCYVNGKQPFDYVRFKAFITEIYEGYKVIMSSDRNVLFQMKAFWVYWGNVFPGMDVEVKKIFMSTTLEEYDKNVNWLFDNRL